MKHYKIYKHPDGNMEAVKQGWSWPAFFFGVIWALVKKLWLLAAILLGVFIIIFVFSLIAALCAPDPDNYISYTDYNKTIDLISQFIGIVIGNFLGINGNSYREKNLLSKGYELVGSRNATNPSRAIAEMLKSKTSESENDNMISHI